MAPDLNSVPASPRALIVASNSPNAAPTSEPRRPSRQNSSSGLQQPPSTSTSRRASQIFPMSPPPLPLASPGTNSNAVEAQRIELQRRTSQSNAVPSSSTGTGGNIEGLGVPMRHPRPLTAAELHLELEKEQEAVVNRLTRELTALRTHSASVASTTSTTSNSTAPVPPDSATSRRHRSSSSISRGSFSHGTIPLNLTSSTLPHQHRQSLSRTHTQDERDGAAHGITRTVSTQRYEEAAQARHDLEEAKKENEVLRQRVMELEGMLRRSRRASEISPAGATSGEEGGG